MRLCALGYDRYDASLPTDPKKSIALELFCLTVSVTMPSSAEFSVFIGVGGWVKPSSWSVILRGTAVCPLWNSPPYSALAADTTTCLRILHSAL